MGVAILLVLFAAAAVQAPQASTLQVQPESVRQGGIVSAELLTEATLVDPVCEWLGSSYPMYPARGGYRILLPVDRLQPTGPAELIVRAAGAGEPVARRTVTISELDTGPVEVIRLSPSRMKLQEDPRLKEQAKRMAEIVRTRTPVQYWRGAFQYPIASRGRNYGKERLYEQARPRSRKRGAKSAKAAKPAPSFTGYHRGTDFGAEMGDPVVAPNAGRVIATERFVLPGNAIWIDHGQGVITGYFHLSQILVKPGDAIEAGQLIGRVGSTGRSTGPHLHWSVSIQGRTVNPAELVALPERLW